MSRIILIRGKPGVGKTALSNALSKRLAIAVIRKDDIYDSLADLISDHASRNAICEKVMKRMIQTNIQNHTPIIVDNSYHYLNHISAFKEWALSMNFELKSVLLVCSREDIWKERFERRKINPKPNNLITDFEELKAHYKTLYTEPLEGELVVDSINSLDVLVDEVVQYLS